MEKVKNYTAEDSYIFRINYNKIVDEFYYSKIVA